MTTARTEKHKFMEVLTEHRTMMEMAAGLDIPHTWCSMDLRAEIMQSI
jgi:hypothetical protein